MPPLDYETDREMLTAALGTIGLTEPADAKLLWIADTLHLAEVECSAAYLAEPAGGRTWRFSPSCESCRSTRRAISRPPVTASMPRQGVPVVPAAAQQFPNPAAGEADAVTAFDLSAGRIRFHRQ